MRPVIYIACFIADNEVGIFSFGARHLVDYLRGIAHFQCDFRYGILVVVLSVGGGHNGNGLLSGLSVDEAFQEFAVLEFAPAGIAGEFPVRRCFKR